MPNELVAPNGNKLQDIESMQDVAKVGAETCNNLRMGLIDVATAKAISKTLGIIIAAYRTQIVYFKERGVVPELSFLEQHKQLSE